MKHSAEFPFAFRCQRSGNCCARPGGVVRVSAEEVARIAAHLGMSEAGFRSRHLAVGGDRLRQSTDSRCVFLDDGTEASCSIYEVRPDQCASWPFWPELRDPAQLRQAMQFCAGIVTGPADQED